VSEAGDTVVVSACLMGRACRYDGRSKMSAAVVAEVERLNKSGANVLAVCPEELGGLGTPRPAAELRGGHGADVLAGKAFVHVVSDDREVTRAFVHGAQLAAHPVTTQSILKARSPSCGCGRAQVDGQVRAGDGVFAALLRSRGVALRTEEDL